MNYGYKKMYIGGQLKDALSGERRKVICPATEACVGEVAYADAADAEVALQEAQKGFLYWKRLSLAERKAWMLKLQAEVIKNEESLREAMMFEMGKTYASGGEDIEAIVNALDFYPNAMLQHSEEILPDLENTHRHQLIKQPAGVVVAYLAWNFPLLNVGYKLGPALAAGCSIIIRPSNLAPLSAYLLGEILAEMKFPAGVINILSGSTTGAADTLTKSPITKVLTMIGSTRSGLKVIGTSTTSMKRISMELGGNAPFIVCADADIDRAVEIGVALKYGNCGQVCVAPNRFLLHESVQAEFLRKFEAKVKTLHVGFGRAEAPDLGPLVSRKDRARIQQMVADDVKAGATLVCGGGIPVDQPKGFFMEPTILTGLTPQMRCFREEIFGPVAAMMTFKTKEEALALANDTIYGLASYVFSNSESLIRYFAEELAFGEVQVNGVKYAMYLPHGGINESGVGHDCSYLALHDYLITKRISTALY